MSYSVRRQVPRSRGPARGILVTLLVLAVLVVGVDLGLRFLAERWLEGRVQDGLSLRMRPDLDIGGFPFLAQFARGEFQEVSATFQDLPVGGVRLEEVTIRLRDVAFERSDVLTGSAGSVRVRRGEGVVEIGEDSFNAFLRDQGIAATVELVGPEVRATAVVQAGDQEATATAGGPLELDGRMLIFAPQEVDVEGAFGIPAAALSFSVELPRLLEGMRYEGVRVREGVLALEADFSGAGLGLGG